MTLTLSFFSRSSERLLPRTLQERISSAITPVSLFTSASSVVSWPTTSHSVLVLMNINVSRTVVGKKIRIWEHVLDVAGPQDANRNLCWVKFATSYSRELLLLQ